MTDAWQTILTYILEGGVVAIATFLITARQIKRKSVLSNDTTQISNLEAVIKDLREESTQRKEEREQYRADLEAERQENAELQQENTAIKMMMCSHMGCVIRKPLMGQGDAWYQTHKSDPALGADYLPINRLLMIFGKEREKIEAAAIEE